jgi:hypothetical protein
MGPTVSCRLNTFMRRPGAWQCTVTFTTAVPTCRNQKAEESQQLGAARLLTPAAATMLVHGAPTMRAVSRVVKPGLMLNGLPHAGAASLGSAYWLVDTWKRGSNRGLNIQQGFQKGAYNSTGISIRPYNSIPSYNSTGIFNRVLEIQQGFEKSR